MSRSRRIAFIFLYVVANFFCFSRVVGEDVGAATVESNGAAEIVGICATFFIASAVLIYVISVFGMRERTFEEALEQQRKHHSGGAALLIPGGGGKKATKNGVAGKADKKKKDQKKKAPAVKQKNQQPTGKVISSNVVNEIVDFATLDAATIVAAVPPPIVTEEAEVDGKLAAAPVEAVIAATTKSSKKKNKGKKPSLEEEPSASILEKVEPKAEIEIEPMVNGLEDALPDEAVVAAEPVLEASVDEVAESVLVGEVFEEEKPEESSVVAVVAADESSSVEAAPVVVNGFPEEEPKERKRKKKKSIAEEAVVPLTDEETINQLKRVLEEKEKVLSETKISHGKLQTKLGENRAFLKAERVKVGEMEVQLAETSLQRSADQTSLNQQLQQKQHDFQTERSSLQLKISSLQEKLQEAGAEAHGRLQHLQNEAKNWREAADRGRKEYESRIHQLEEEHQRVKQAAVDDAKSLFNRQMQELQEKLQQAETRAAVIAKELAESQRVSGRVGELSNAVEMRETQISQLNSQLTEAENSRNAMDTQIKMLEGRIQDVVAQNEDARAKLLIAEEAMSAQASQSTDSSDNGVVENAEVVDLQNVVASKDAEISRMQGELESIKLEVLNLVNLEKDKVEAATASAAASLREKEARLDEEITAKKELEGKLAKASTEIGEFNMQIEKLEKERLDPEVEQNRLVEALQELQSTTASNIAKEEATASVDDFVKALKSSFALHLLPSSLTSNTENFFDHRLTTALQKLIDNQISSKDEEYIPQIQALKEALNVRIEDAEDKIKEDQQGEEISKLQAELEKTSSSMKSTEEVLSDRDAELQTKAAIVLDLESTIAETKQQLFQLQTSLTQEAESAAKLRDLVSAKELEIVEKNRLLESSKEELASSVDKAIDAAVAQSSQVFDEEKRKLEHTVKEKEKKHASEVDHYNAVLKETESMLSKLQASVEAEESRWSVKFAIKEEEMQKWKRERETEERVARETTEALKSEMESKLASSQAEKDVWEAEKLEIHARLADTDAELDRERETARNAAVELESKGSLEAQFVVEKEAKEELQRQLDSVSTSAKLSQNAVDTLTSELMATQQALDKASKDVDVVGGLQRAAEGEVASLKGEVGTLKSQLATAASTAAATAAANAAPASTPTKKETTPTKKDKKEKEKKSDEKKKIVDDNKNGEVRETEGAVSMGDNISLGESEKKKKGKSLSKLFSPKTK